MPMVLTRSSTERAETPWTVSASRPSGAALESPGIRALAKFWDPLFDRAGRYTTKR
jgi:hypothetical protein